MANSITTTLLINGTRLFVAKIDIICDTAAELSAVTILTAAGLTKNPSKFKIRNISWQFSNFYAKLLWKATANVQAISLNQYEGDLDFFEDAGVPLINNAGSGVNGDLLITTTGVAATSSGTIIIRGYHK